MLSASFGSLDYGILLLYALLVLGMGIYYTRKTKTSHQFMVADRSIPAWAAGLAVMSTYTSSISYIATPGKAYDDNWHPLIFALSIFPVAWFVTRYMVPYYRKVQLISVYEFLERKLGVWGRFYAAFSFILYIVGRVAVILYLSALLLGTFTSWDIRIIIIAIGLVTLVYTLLGGMEAVIWTDVIQSLIMIVGLLYCAVTLTGSIFAEPQMLVNNALELKKFNLGSLDFSFTSRTVWVMIIYGLTENMRNLFADQNFVQKYSSVATEEAAKKSVWLAMLIYIPMTVIFLYIGTALFAFYSPGGATLPADVTKGDQVFPFFIATQLPIGLKGLVVAAIMAAAMSTLDSALNSSATVLLLDFYKKFRPQLSEQGSMLFLRAGTVVWGLIGTAFALLMINARSALDIWWQISGIFGGGILGLFLLALLRIRLRMWQGLVAIGVSVLLISWATFARNLPSQWHWFECQFDPIITGAFGTLGLLVVALVFHFVDRSKKNYGNNMRSSTIGS